MRVPIAYPKTKLEDRLMGPAPLSPAVRLGNMLFISGQVAIDPTTGAIMGDDVATQTRQVLMNIRMLVEAAGLTMGNIGKVGIFLTDVGCFDAMNAVYTEFFDAPFPARATVGITLNNPSLLVEMDAIAVAV
ncbi:Rid family detoxifying hydrolase [Microvirga calopogonii]|uniref:Rid family detoxifying hydrolase n=1 Tax=Microvirga calopogonii TaxID=2078013 RepID=UPI000E0D0FFD|nr:Rid family detoxifying hydrolase [Microvirga calopogonii]